MNNKNSDAGQSQWQWEQNRLIAERSHDIFRKFANLTNRAAIDSGALALRTLVLINGGAAIAFLAFLGSIIGADKIKIALDQTTEPVIWFAAGIVTTTAGMGFTYFANSSYTISIQSYKHQYQQPFVQETKDSKFWGRLGVVFHFCAIFFATSSLACFVVGIYEVRSAVNFVL